MTNIGINGAVPYYKRNEINNIISDLKKEFSEDVKIYIKHGFVQYRCKVSRDQIYY